MIKKLTRLFPLWAILISVVAFYQPTLFVSLESIAIQLLGLIMFGMGVTLKFSDFSRVFKKPGLIALGVSMQFLLMPLIAWLISKGFGLPEQIMVGMILVGCCPGGTASNVVSYLAGADVALSITLTLVSTMLSFAVTPFLAWFYIGSSVSVPVIKMLIMIFKIIVLPVFIGSAVNSFWGQKLKKVRDVFPLVSVIGIVVIIAIVVALNKDNISTCSFIVFAAVILHNISGLAAGYGVARLLRVKEPQARTLAIEVGMQNSGLAVALAIKYFSTLAALAGAIFSIWHNLSGSLLAGYWSSKKKIKEDRL